MESKVYLGWVDFYMELADKLLAYKNNRKALIEKIKTVYNALNMRLPKLEADNNLIDIDPFTIFGLFNKGITDENRIAILKGIGQEFSVKADVPTSFDGIPVLNNLAATFYYFIGERQDNDIDNLWQVFVSALEYADTNSESSKKAFIEAYDAALQQKGVKWNLTMGLYWIRPYKFINLDSRNRWYICNPQNMPADYVESVGNFETIPNGEEYLAIIYKSRIALEKGDYRYKNFPELSYYAWVISEQVNKEKQAAALEKARTNVGEAIGDKDVRTVHYWIYSPGNNACMWNDFYEAGMMAIGWDDIGDLTAFASKEAIKQKMQECMDATLSYKNGALALWQFANEMKPGDVVFVKGYVTTNS